MEERRDALDWSEDKSVDGAVGNTPEPTAEEIENKMKLSLEKELNNHSRARKS